MRGELQLEVPEAEIDWVRYSAHHGWRGATARAAGRRNRHRQQLGRSALTRQRPPRAQSPTESFFTRGNKP